MNNIKLQFEKVWNTIKNSQQFRVAFDKLPDWHYTVIQTKDIRSNGQNSRYWAMISEIAKETWDLHVYNIHMIVKAMFMKKTTTDMDVAMFTDLMDFVEQWAFDFLGMTFPQFVDKDD